MSTPFSKLFLFLFLLAGLLLTAVFLTNQPATAQAPLWTTIQSDQIPALRGGERQIVPQQYQLYQLDLDQMQAELATAPLEFTPAAQTAPLMLTLPLADGTLAEFVVVESSIMEPELAAKYPAFKTYAGRMVADPATTVRLDVTHHGFHAMIIGSSGTSYIDPYRTQDSIHYQVYAKADYERETGFFEIGVLDKSGADALALPTTAVPAAPPTGPQLYTYRLAMAATGEYTQFHGGTVADGMAAIVTAMNRVNHIYERDTAVRMILIANNDLVVYTNPATDPYTNNSGGTMLGQNQANLDAVIGNANYDVGHVFSTGGGGIATLGVPCETGWKARGVTGLPQPINDPFYVDYVAHEIGHQYGALHTFNGSVGACSGGNRTASAAYEPGSGTTIMAYAGICGAQNIQLNSDDHFHTYSIDQIVNYTRFGQGNQCAQIINTGNNAPTADAGTGGFTIPINTPFMLTGEASDPDAELLSYNWEQLDLGPAGAPNSPSGNAPIFRSFPSTSSPTRTFPRLFDIVNNTQTIGEILPSYTRSLTFRFTVRDNNVFPSAGGVDSDTIAFDVTNTAGPFLVTNPNTAVTWTGLTNENVTWNVANTNQSPVSCATVDIALSTDGGYTYPITLATAVPNNGSASVTVPNLNTNMARVMVKCATNIFFDISNADFTIELGNAAVLDISKTADPAPDTAVLAGDTVTYTIVVDNSGTLPATVTLTDTLPYPLADVVCDGETGDLVTTFPLPAGESADFDCTAVVTDAFGLDLSHTVDQPIVSPGTAVSYTITVTNPHPVALENVLVESDHPVACSPALGVPFGLDAYSSVSFVCANIIATEGQSYIASASAELPFQNVATASAPEAMPSMVSSDPVAHYLTLQAAASAEVLMGAGLQVSHTAVSPTALGAGDTLTYTVVVTNTGDVSTTATLSDSLGYPFVATVCPPTFAIAGQEVVELTCTAVVNPDLTLDLRHTADEMQVRPNTAVSFTIGLSNSHPVTLTNVVVDGNHPVACTPPFTPDAPFSLPSQTEASFVCAAVSIMTESVVYTASATAEMAWESVLTVSASALSPSTVSSAPLTGIVSLATAKTAQVTVGWQAYLPILTTP